MTLRLLVGSTRSLAAPAGKQPQAGSLGHAVAILLLAVALPLLAHHSTAPFDMTRGVIVTGTVTEFRWANPHSYIMLAGVEEEAESLGHDASPQDWTIEIEALGLLRRFGWSKDTLKLGDVVSCRGARAKKADLFALKCFTLIFPDGRRMEATPAGQPSGR